MNHLRSYLTGLDQLVQKGDAVTLSAITEELGGMRQVGKLLPAIREFKKAEQALKEATKGAAEGLGPDVAKGLTPLIKQFEILGARFEDFIRKISESSTFKQLAGFAIDTANAFLSLGEALTPILPLLTQLAAMKLARGAFSFGQGFFGSTKGLGAQGAGARAGSLVAGSGGGAVGAKQSTMTNTGALGKNTSALSVLSAALKPLPSLSGEFKKLNTALYTLKDEIRRLASVSRARPPSVPYYGGGAGGTRRGRRGLSGGGTVGSPRRKASSGGSRVRFSTPTISQVPPFAPRQNLNQTNFRRPLPITRPLSQTGTSLLSSKGAKRTGMGATLVDIRKGVSPKARQATTFGAISLRDTLGSSIAGEKVTGGANPLKAFYASVKFAGSVNEPGLGIGVQKRDTKGKLIANVASPNAPYAGSKGRRSLSSIAGSRLAKGAVSSDEATIQVYTDTLDQKVEKKFEDDISSGLSATTDLAAKGLYSLLKVPAKASKIDPKKAGINFENISGNLFELALNEVGGKYASTKAKGNQNFDFPAGIGGLAKAFSAHGGKLGTIPTDAKRSINMESVLSLMKKGKNTLQALNERITNPTQYKQRETKSQKRRALLAASRRGRRSPQMKLTPAAKGLQRSQVEDPDYWTDDGNLKAILMPGELVSYGANPATARQIGAGNVSAVRSLSPRDTSVVPGSGNRDTYPMDLPPGTVVVPKALSQEAMGAGYEPRKPLSTGGRVGRGRVKMADGFPGATGWQRKITSRQTSSGASKANEKIMQKANANFGQLADTAIGLSFALQMIDFSTFQGAIVSFSQLAFVIPSALASLKELPLALKAAQFAISGGTRQTGVDEAGNAITETKEPMGRWKKVGAAIGVAFGIAVLSETIGKGLAKKFQGKITKGSVEGVEKLDAGGAETALGIRSFMAGLAGVGIALALFKLGLLTSGKAMGVGLTTAVVLAARAYSDYTVQLKKNVEFIEFAKFGEGVKKATETLKLFNKQAFVSAEGTRNITTAGETGLSITERLGGVAYDRAFAEESANTGIGAGIGTAIGIALAPYTFGLSIPIGAAAGYAVEEAVQGGDTDRAAGSLKSGERLLSAVSDKLIEEIGKAFEKITDDFVTSLAAGSDVFNKIAAIKAPLDGVGSSSLAVRASFNLLQEVLKDTGDQGRAFADFLNTKVKAGMIESIKASDENVKRLFGAAASQGLDFSNIQELNDNMAALSLQAGFSGKEFAQATAQLETFRTAQERNVINTINQKTANEQLDRMLKQVTKSIELFIVGLELMSTIMDQGASRFEIFAGEVSDFASYATGGGGRILQPGRSSINPFSNIDSSSEAAVNAGVDRVGRATGADLKGVKETLRLRKIIPGLAKILGEKKGGQKIQTGAELRDHLADVLKDEFNLNIGDLPKTIRDSLEKGLDAHKLRVEKGYL